MRKFGFVKLIKEEVIGSENTFLAWAVLGAVGVIMAIGFYLNSPNTSFHGIAGSREANVNFEYPVEIKRVHVITGQRVKKGDLLVELDQSDLNTQIRQLSAQIGRLKAERSVRDQMNKAVGNDGQALADDPLLFDIRQLEEERAHLERQRDNLYVFADIDGIVGSVNFKRGERAPSFASLVTISPDSPTFVQGFVYEALRTSVQPGQSVEIASQTNSAASVTGKVISVGSRFVEVPARLVTGANSNNGSMVWGREVVVEIPKDSGIILGEKVQISPRRFFLPSLVAQADEKKAVEEDISSAPPAIRLSRELSEKTNFEASGALYLSDLKKYLVVSDDTDNLESPWLFLMAEDGEVDDKPLVIPGIEQISDMESVSRDGSYLYVMTSLTTKKKGGLNPARNIFVRMKRDRLALSGTEVIPFGQILRRLMEESSEPKIKALSREDTEKLEVEAHSVKDGALYIALKSPQSPDNGDTLILRIPNVDQLFARRGAGAKAELWQSVAIEAEDGFRHRISDMTFIDDTLYFTTTGEKGRAGGAIWSLGRGESRPRALRAFKNARPEGIAYNAEKNLFLLTFDGGDLGSSFSTLPGPTARK